MIHTYEDNSGLPPGEIFHGSAPYVVLLTLDDGDVVEGMCSFSILLGDLAAYSETEFFWGPAGPCCRTNQRLSR